MRMRVGVVILPQFSAAETGRRWKSLEDRGFAHGWTYDHLAWGVLADEDWYATVPTLTVAALATSTIGIGTWVASPNFRHPVPFAKDLMTLDEISAGRLIAGIGAGGLGFDAEVLGDPPLSPRDRADRLIEFLELTDLLLRQSETTWRGRWFTAEHARMNPAGSRNRVPLVVAGAGPRTIALAATYDGWATYGPVPAVDDADDWWRGVADQHRRFLSGSPAAAGLRRMLNLDAMPGYDHSSLDCFQQVAGRAAEIGFTDAVIHWPRRGLAYAGDETVLDEIADRLTGGDLAG